MKLKRQKQPMSCAAQLAAFYTMIYLVNYVGLIYTLNHKRT